MCFVNISLITDYDAGLEGSKEIKPVVYSEVLKIFKQNNDKLEKLILEMLKHWPEKRTCDCERSLEGAKA